MNDREHRVLDGELSAEALTAEERLRLKSLAGAADDAAQAIRELPVPDLTPRIMSAVRAAEVATAPKGDGWLRLLRWLWEPRPLSLSWRPAHAAVAAVAAVFLLVSGVARLQPPLATERMPTAVERTTAVVYVQFKLEAPGASSVEVAGSFTNWMPGVHLSETSPGIWSTLLPLEPGVHDYTFIIDGAVWVIDPTAPAVDDGFGGANSRLFLNRPLGNA